MASLYRQPLLKQMTSKFPISYQDKSLTITKDFITIKGGDHEAIRIDWISEVRITREQKGDYKAGAILFFIIGAFTIMIGIGLLFFALGIAAWNTNIWEYRLQIKVVDETITLRTSKRKSNLKALANTIRGLSLSNKLHAVV